MAVQGRRSCPVGRSDARVGESDATRGYPMGISDQELLITNYYFQIVVSLYPTLFFA